MGTEYCNCLPRNLRTVQLVQAYTLCSRSPGIHLLQAYLRDDQLPFEDNKYWVRPNRDTICEGFRIVEQPLNRLKQGGNGIYLGIQVAVQGNCQDIHHVPGDEPVDLVALSDEE